MSAILDYVNAYVIVALLSSGTTLVLSQKIKDFVRGVPSAVRAELSAVETKALTNLQSLQVSAVHAAITAVTPAPAAPVAPVAPAAPAAPAA